MKMIADKEVDDAFAEEHDAALAFARLLQQERVIESEKIAARHRLNLAREEKRQLLVDLMSA